MVLESMPISTQHLHGRPNREGSRGRVLPKWLRGAQKDSCYWRVGGHHHNQVFTCKLLGTMARQTFRFSIQRFCSSPIFAIFSKSATLFQNGRVQISRGSPERKFPALPWKLVSVVHTQVGTSSPLFLFHVLRKGFQESTLEGVAQARGPICSQAT